MRRECNGKCDKLIENIVQKAEGVFLWVILILRELAQGLTDGDSMSDLQKTVTACPDDLNRFLQRIIASIPANKQRLAYRTFAITTMLSSCGRSMLLLNYSFLEDYNVDSKFALSIPFNSEWSLDETNARLAVTRRRLTAHCKELILIEDRPHGPNAPKVGFILRSVREIFEEEKVKAAMAEHLEDFDTLDAILQTHLAGIKRDADYEYNDDTTVSVVIAVRGLLDLVLRTQPQCTAATNNYLDCIATCVLHRQGTVARSFHEVDWSELNYVVGFAGLDLLSSKNRVVSLVHQAGEESFGPYLEWTVNNFPDFAKNHEAATEVLYSYCTSFEKAEAASQGRADGLLVENMFRMGLSPNFPRSSGSELYQHPIWWIMLRRLLGRCGKDFWLVVELLVSRHHVQGVKSGCIEATRYCRFPRTRERRKFKEAHRAKTSQGKRITKHCHTV